MIEVRAITPEDFPAIETLEFTYHPERYLAVERSGEAPEHAFALRWREQTGAAPVVYARPTAAWLSKASLRADLFLVALSDGSPVGYIIVVVPPWMEQLPADRRAAEITDLAIDRHARRLGAAKALVEEATAWARAQSYRAVWVEPRSDNAPAIDFYLSMGFRVSGFNDRLYSNEDDEPGRTTVYMYLELV